LTAQQPYNNVVRVTMQALAAVLGGTQSLHTNSLDETYALPTEEAVTIALRTQQIIADESGVAKVVDPLGGSYFIESLTDEIEKRAIAYIDKIDAMGGIVEAIEAGFPQREIAESAYRFQQAVEQKREIIVGVNKYQDESETVSPIPTLKIEHAVEDAQIARCKQVRAQRDKAAHAAAMATVKAACQGRDNLMYPIVEAVKVGATLGEISNVFREVFGVYRDPGDF
jgi:methylmalonyl-CoA mutase, N-terminal domain